jgi:hypothetical protein
MFMLILTRGDIIVVDILYRTIARQIYESWLVTDAKCGGVKLVNVIPTLI